MMTTVSDGVRILREDQKSAPSVCAASLTASSCTRMPVIFYA